MAETPGYKKEIIIPDFIPFADDFMLNYAEICDMKTLKNAEKSRSLGMIKVLFICHGNICLRSAGSHKHWAREE